GLDKDDLASDGRPDHAGGNAGTINPLGYLFKEALAAQVFGKLIGGDMDGCLPPFCDLLGNLTTEGADLALQIAYACLACIIASDAAQHGIIERQLVLVQAVGFELLW